MSATHTPGPWKVDAGETYNVRDAATEGVVAQIHFLRGRHGLAGRITAEQGLANANLIAAAPELLEALKRAEPALWIMATSGHADAVAIHAECRAAIAHAEGGQS